MKIVQTIHIGNFTINSLGGASIVQVGSSGMIQSHSESYETTEVAKAPVKPLAPPTMPVPEAIEEPFVKGEVPEISLRDQVEAFPINDEIPLTE